MMIQRMRRFLDRGWRDNRGAAAIEFAFIAPILFILYFMTGEISQAIETNKKVGRIASMVGDLVAQQTKTKRGDLDAILDIGAAIIQPYGRSKPTIIIEHIKVDNKPKPEALVTWSRKLENGAKKASAKGVTTVPDELLVPGTHLVRVTSHLAYEPVITWEVEQKASLGLASAFDLINMRESYYLRPRMSPDVKCDDC